MFKYYKTGRKSTSIFENTTIRFFQVLSLFRSIARLLFRNRSLPSTSMQKERKLALIL